MNFLRMMADRYGLSPDQTEVFVARFNEDNRERSEAAIKENLKKFLRIDIEVEPYRKRMRNVYAKFAWGKQNPEGCLELNNLRSHKFDKLLEWLLGKYGKPESYDIKYSDGFVPLNSPFYVERDPVELRSYETVEEPGSLIRIKAPKSMGKTSLMRRVLAKSEEKKWKNVYLDLSGVEASVFSNLEKLERWFCVEVGQQLNLDNKLKDYWDEEFMTVNGNCTSYFKNYLLKEINCPLVLGLDEVDRLFLNQTLAADFFPMLRNWHEEGKVSKTWEKLRIVLAYATEVYIPLDLNRSPFNVGFSAELPQFNGEQIENLAKVYQLKLNKKEITDFMAMVGGHPYLVRLGFDYLAIEGATMKELLINAPTQAGIYSDRLIQILDNYLEKSPELKEAFKSVVTSSKPVVLKPQHSRKLCALGLVEQEENHVVPSCNLYREYFKNVLSL